MAQAAAVSAAARKGGAKMVEERTDKLERDKADIALISGVALGESSSAEDANPTAAGVPAPGRTWGGGAREVTTKSARGGKIPRMKPPDQ